jgi:hypothetical protein
MVFPTNIEEIIAAGKFTTLVRPYESAIGEAVRDEELVDDINRGGLAVGEEHPDIPRSFINNK